MLQRTDIPAIISQISSGELVSVANSNVDLPVGTAVVLENYEPGRSFVATGVVAEPDLASNGRMVLELRSILRQGEPLGRDFQAGDRVYHPDDHLAVYSKAS